MNDSCSSPRSINTLVWIQPWPQTVIIVIINRVNQTVILTQICRTAWWPLTLCQTLIQHRSQWSTLTVLNSLDRLQYILVLSNPPIDFLPLPLYSMQLIKIFMVSL